MSIPNLHTLRTCTSDDSESGSTRQEESVECRRLVVYEMREGRLKEIINKGGEKISPLEIDKVVYSRIQ